MTCCLISFLKYYSEIFFGFSEINEEMRNASLIAGTDIIVVFIKQHMT